MQSVAVRIIVDREEEIRKFKPEEYWTIDAKFIPKGSRKSFSASLYSDANGKIKIRIRSRLIKSSRFTGCRVYDYKGKTRYLRNLCTAVYHFNLTAGSFKKARLSVKTYNEGCTELYEEVLKFKEWAQQVLLPI